MGEEADCVTSRSPPPLVRGRKGEKGEMLYIFCVAVLSSVTLRDGSGMR